MKNKTNKTSVILRCLCSGSHPYVKNNKVLNKNFSGRHTTKAFTLIELLVVVLIIGILAAIALPQYQRAVAHSRFATVKNLVKSMADAQEVYYLANGKYSNNLSELDIQMPKGYNETTSTENILKYDWGNCRSSSSGQSYCQYNFSDFTVQFQIVGPHSSYHLPGKQICVAFYTDDTSSKQAKFCQRETGKSTPGDTTSPNLMYFYN
ncbi:MAG: prepilin-type N-terminal cleavage/methylation domain-containing protein [Elusimicrobiaceae bacterium]|nr:prepilin-type N-terminal cleavage/methylation domain-containing protein [Elusimicrobiaceae bacterium]